jgi:serine/threonine protein phosphatase 1
MPDEPLFVVGDVHGRSDLLLTMLDQRPTDAKLILLGDLIDRGPDSARVLKIAQDLCHQSAICIMGNHELMFLDFLEKPERRGAHWLRNGGLQTLESFGLTEATERMSADQLLAVRDNLLEIIPSDLVEWMQQMPLHWASGNVHCVHAGADPHLNMTQQKPNVLLWGKDDFLTGQRQDGQWVVHGHTIVENSEALDGKINVDTGAFATGKLTAAHIERGQVRFIVAAE